MTNLDTIHSAFVDDRRKAERLYLGVVLQEVHPDQVITVTGELRMVTDPEAVLVFKKCVIDRR